MSTTKARKCTPSAVRIRPLLRIDAGPGQCGRTWPLRDFGQVFEIEGAEHCAEALELPSGTPPPNRLLVDAHQANDWGLASLTRRGNGYAIEMCDKHNQEDLNAHAVGVIVGHWRQD